MKYLRLHNVDEIDSLSSISTEKHYNQLPFFRQQNDDFEEK